MRARGKASWRVRSWRGRAGWGWGRAGSRSWMGGLGLGIAGSVSYSVLSFGGFYSF